ncbi:hypothetical protein HPB47_024637 [Ixodes persulcatus]|uniref:Uncharacterized protein n=1 Tax=Ixodes persulcatus TaxID=34615 RepID=A0AC60Q621_IXOPE|nr:hypothetical protein HPB47_024637 [Ixodes persulcatus]
MSNDTDYLQGHHTHLRQAALRGASILRKRSLWSCNRFIVSRELWKAVMVPGLTFANAVVCVPGDVRANMERRQRDVGRQALSCKGAVTNEAVQGDLGWSSFEAREASSKIAYDGRLRLMDRCRWAKRLFIYTNLTGLRTRWQKRLYQLQHKYGFFSQPVDASTETEWSSEVRKRVRDSETQQWLQDAQTKSTLGVYLANKITIASEVRLYDNSLGSRFLFEARAGALRTLSYRRRLDTTVTSTMCRVCGVHDVTVEHIVLDCARLKPSRTQDNGPRRPRPLALAEALDFIDSKIGQSTAVCPATGLKVASNDIKRIVADTKRRLEDWWQKIHLREH